MKGTSNPHKLRIFLCHSSDDKLAVHKIYKSLRSDGFAPWLDKEDLLGGLNWQQEIPKVVRNSDVIIVCLSRNSVGKSGYVQKEIKIAREVADKEPEGTNFLIPLKLEKCETPEQLRCLHCINLYDEEGYERLRRSLEYRVDALKRITRPAAEVASHSTSTTITIYGPNNPDSQLPEKGLQARRSASATVPWIFSTALLTLLLVILVLRPNQGTSSLTSPPTVETEVQTDGIDIRNTNGYQIVELEAYLMAYKFDRVRHHMIDRSRLDVSKLLIKGRKLVPLQETTILTSKLFPPTESPQYGASPDSDEIIIRALVITYRREIDGRKFLEVTSFTTAQDKSYGQTLLFPLLSPEKSTTTDKKEEPRVLNSSTVGVEPYVLFGIVQKIKSYETESFLGRLIVDTADSTP